MLYDKINWLSTETERDLCSDWDSLSEVSEKSDFVTSACRLTKETSHLVKAYFLAQKKPNRIRINISRGSVIDEEAVADAADVFEMKAGRCRTGPR